LLLVCKNQIPVVCQACRILLTYLIGKLPQQTSQPGESIGPTILTTRQLLLPIRALCIGQSLLAKSEEVALIAIMKNAKLPQSVKSSPSTGEKEGSPQPIKETKRVRNDLSTSILEQLTMPLQDFTINHDIIFDSTNKSSSESANNEQGIDIKVRLIHMF
jgi:hypothetical protein